MVVVLLRDEEVINVLRLHWQFTMHQFSRCWTNKAGTQSSYILRNHHRIAHVQILDRGAHKSNTIVTNVLSRRMQLPYALLSIPLVSLV